MRALVSIVAAVLLLAGGVARADDYVAPGDAAAPAPMDDGWGSALPDRTRGLPECDPNAAPPPPGGVYTCRPWYPRGTQWSLGVDWTSGAADGPEGLLGSVQGLGVQADFALNRAFGAGLRYQLLGFGRGTPPGGTAHDSAALAQDLLAQLRWRLWTDEVDRNAWTLTGGLGWSFRARGLDSGAVARVAIGHDVGIYVTHHAAMTAAIEIAYEQALGDPSLRMVLASVRGGFEVGIRDPLNLDEPASAPELDYSAGGSFRAGTLFGLGFDVGVPLGRFVELRFTVDQSYGHNGPKLRGFDGASWGALGGVRLRSGDGIAAGYVEAQAGWDWTGSESGPGRPPGGAARGDLELGARFGLGCFGSFAMGVRQRTRIDGDGLHRRGLGFVLRFELGGNRATAGRCLPAPASRPLPPPPPAPAPPPPETTAVPTPSVDAGAGGSVEGGATVEVEVKPVVIEVELGAVLFGGAVQVHIDPRILPLARLRGAGFVKVELIGPAAQLARFEGELRAVLGRNGLSAQAWARTDVDARVVRARFTIWPPGTQPTP